MGVYVGDNLVAGNVGEVYSKAQVDAMIANAVALAEPTGSIKPFAGTTVPDGYLLCDGSAVSRTTYAALFAVIGTTYGTGDGSTTFNVPDLNGRVPFGMGGTYRGQVTNGIIPNITGTGTLRDMFTQQFAGTGAFYNTNNTATANYAGAMQMTRAYIVFGFDASRSSSVYNNNSWFDGQRVVPSSVGMSYVIKY